MPKTKTDKDGKKIPYCITNRSIGRGDCVSIITGKTVNTDRIYELEDVIRMAIRKACEWREKNFEEDLGREAMPAELLHVLEAFDNSASYLAARTFVEEYEGRKAPNFGGQTYDPDALQVVMPDAQPLTADVRERIAKNATELFLTPADIKSLQREYQCLKNKNRQFNDICVIIYEIFTGKEWTSPFRGRGRTSRLAGWTLAGIMRGKTDPYKYAMENN